MIAIINKADISKEEGKELCYYELFINKEMITSFTHVREDGLAVCLHKAARAVERTQYTRWLELFDAER